MYNYPMKKFFGLSLLLLGSLLFAESFTDIERRRDQYLSDPGYFIAPVPYSLPGIGTGLMGLGFMNNVNETQTDVVLYGVGGDVTGYGFAVADLYLIDKHLKFELLHSGFDKASIQSFSTRGMESARDDYINVEVGSMSFTGLRTTASFYEKMVEFYAMAYLNSFKLKSLKDKEGNTILDASDSKEQKSNLYIGGFMIDYTDDRLDPRRGVRFDAGLDYSPRENGDSADYYVTNYNLTGYLPVGKRSSWVFNYFRSDAHVISKGESDFDTLSETFGLECDTLSDPLQKQQCESYVYNAIAANTRGSATGLGGRSRLRSYKEGRYSEAHTEFLGTEFRWNITQEMTPFDIWFMKDIRTGVQAAFFYEVGTVAESASQLWKSRRPSYGAGARVVMASGLVYRVDAAHGREGVEVTVIVNYPWEIF